MRSEWGTTSSSADAPAFGTPMHWTGDRNAGFSRADPSRLTAPVVSDPVGGHQAVNVEVSSGHLVAPALVEAADCPAAKPCRVFSWWCSSARAWRRPGNFLHRHGSRRGRAANRSHRGESRRTTQSVELNLQEYAGLTPVEMSGRSALPRIGDASYHLTLPPFAFYWLQLERAPRRFTRLVESDVEELARIPWLTGAASRMASGRPSSSLVWPAMSFRRTSVRSPGLEGNRDQCRLLKSLIMVRLTAVRPRSVSFFY